MNNRYIHSIRKSTSKKYTVILLAIIFSLLFKNHDSNCNHDHSTIDDNPFFKIFYSYYSDEKESAKESLENLFSNSRYGNRAIINYGLLIQHEKDYDKAEKFFKRSFDKGEKLALLYLFGHYSKTNSSPLRLLNSLHLLQPDSWIDYERALYHLKKNKRELAQKYLKKAVDNGFCSVKLLDREPLLSTIKHSKEFKLLYKKARRNIKKRRSLKSIVEAEKFDSYRYKPYGISKQLQIAAYLEKRRRYGRAEDLLLAYLKGKIPFKDKSIALYWLARLKAKRGNKKGALTYLAKFVKHLSSDKSDRTGYQRLVKNHYQDIIRNDRYLKKLNPVKF